MGKITLSYLHVKYETGTGQANLTDSAEGEAKMKNMARLIQILASTIVVQFAFAAPVVQGVSGQVANGATITINGTAFGNNGPNLELFDDFEGGANGEIIHNGSGSATIGEWNGTHGARPPTYSNLEALSGQMAFRGDFTGTSGVQTWTSQTEKVFSQPTTEFFGSWWWLIPAGTNLPGYGGNGINWKTVWIMDMSRGPGMVEDDLTLPTFVGNETTVYGAAIGSNGASYTEWITMDWSKGVWKRSWVWLKGSTDLSGQVHYWELTASGVQQRLNDNNVKIYSTSRSEPPHQWDQIHINGYGRATPNCYPMFDDVYLATGPNARARVEIGNAPTYTSCTKLTICTPESWSNTAVTATVRAGQFQLGDGAFLYVFGANGVCNVVGYPVEFGEPQPSSIRVMPQAQLNAQKRANARVYDLLGRSRQRKKVSWANGVWLTTRTRSADAKQRSILIE